MHNETYTSTASRLCQACGLCCNGVMFHTVRLRPADVPRELAALGVKLKRKKGKDWILQPCPAYREACCAIYEQRPERCRRFECQQLQRVATGQSTEVMALQKIQEVKKLTSWLDTQSRRHDGSVRKGPLTTRCEAVLAEPFDATTTPELIEQRQQLASKLSQLDSILDTDFRIPRF